MLQKEERNTQAGLELALNLEEVYWKEKSNINWNLHGDRNTKKNHIYAKIKNTTKLISSFMIDNRVVVEKKLIESHVENHFKSLFNQDSLPHNNGLIEEIIPSLVQDSTNTLLTIIPIKEEIHQAILNKI